MGTTLRHAQAAARAPSTQPQARRPRPGLGPRQDRRQGRQGPEGPHGPPRRPPGFEGGQMPLQRRLPKRGFKNPFRVDVCGGQRRRARRERSRPASVVDPERSSDAGHGAALAPSCSRSSARATSTTRSPSRRTPSRRRRRRRFEGRRQRGDDSARRPAEAAARREPAA